MTVAEDPFLRSSDQEMPGGASRGSDGSQAGGLVGAAGSGRGEGSATRTKNQRRHERIRILADAPVRPVGGTSARYGARGLNVSKSGIAVFTEYSFLIGKPVEVELILPVRGLGMRQVVLCGIVRWVRAEESGNTVGIEFQGPCEDPWFEEFLDQRSEALAAPAGEAPRRGFTLTEACIALVIVCLLVTMATPVYRQAMEQARVDAANGNLRTVWSAQRIYWLEYRAFASDLNALEAMDLVDKALAATQSDPNAVFVYTIGASDAESFTATAMRNGSGIWVGQIDIDETGEVTGAINGPGGVTLTPPPS